MYKTHPIEKIGLFVLKLVLWLGLAASCGVGVLILATGDMIGLPWLFLPIILVSALLAVVGVLLQFIGQFLSARRNAA